MRGTYFASVTDRAASTMEFGWDGLCGSIETPSTYPNKESCPLLKLAGFGNVLSSRGHPRHDANVLWISGVEGDHDSGAMSPAEAAEKLRAAGVESIIYTSASHTPQKPRWRVLAPLSVEYPPEYRRGFLESLDAILGHSLARESYALSQAYYVGRVEGAEYAVHRVEGRFLDHLVEPVAKPLDLVTGDIVVPEWRHVAIEPLLIDDEAKRLIRDGAAEGERSEALMSAANALARARVPRDDILRILADPAHQISAKALDGRRQKSAMEWLARHTVTKALAAFPPLDVVFGESTLGQAQGRESLFLAAGELTTERRPINWLVRDVIERPVLGMMFGDPGAGKSFVALDWACCIATGREWLGRAVVQGPVAYIAGEGYGGLGRRLKAWSIYNGVELNGAPLFVSRRGVAFNDPQALGALMGELDAMTDPPALIVIDTLARATPGLDEDRAKEMGAFVGACDRLREKYGATVLVIHHSPHGDKSRAKGSIALKGAVDFEAGVMRAGQDGVIRLASTKMKEGEPFADIFMRFERVQLPWLDDDGSRFQVSAVLVGCEAPAKSPAVRKFKLTAADKVLHLALGKDPIVKEKVREVFHQIHGGSEEARERAWYRSMRRGVERGWFTDDGHTLTPSVFSIMRDQRGDAATDATDNN